MGGCRLRGWQAASWVESKGFEPEKCRKIPELQGATYPASWDTCRWSEFRYSTWYILRGHPPRPTIEWKMEGGVGEGLGLGPFIKMKRLWIFTGIVGGGYPPTYILWIMIGSICLSYCKHALSKANSSEWVETLCSNAIVSPYQGKRAKHPSIAQNTSTVSLKYRSLDDKSDCALPAKSTQC